MNKRLVMFVVLPIVMALLIIGLYLWSQSGIEGCYRASVSQPLDGSRRYIQLKNGEIRGHSQSAMSDMEIIGSYKPIGDGWYVLTYDKGRFSNREPITMRAKGGLKGLTCNLEDLIKLDIMIGVHKRLHFWDFW